MKDLTRGSIVSHILNMAPPIMVGMITIMICQLVDLYFVSGSAMRPWRASLRPATPAFSSTR